MSEEQDGNTLFLEELRAGVGHAAHHPPQWLLKG